MTELPSPFDGQCPTCRSWLHYVECQDVHWRISWVTDNKEIWLNADANVRNPLPGWLECIKCKTRFAVPQAFQVRWM